MGHIFISYSRKDTNLVRRLHAALKAEGRETWVDWEGIPPSDKWMARIHSAIDEAEAFIYVISPDSVSSAVCGQELDYALQQHMRIIPILHRELDSPVRPELSEINWVFARETDSFESACEMVIKAIDTDLDWVRAHTRLRVRAVEWDQRGRDPSYTLRGSDLVGFEEWAARAPVKEPKPTVLQSEYLLASRRAVTRRQRITWASIAAALCIAVALGTVAWFQNRERDRQAEIASARQLLSKAEAMRDIPMEESGALNRHKDGTRAAARALVTLDRLGEASFDAEQSVRKSYTKLAKWRDIDLSSATIKASDFDIYGRFLALYTTASEIMLMDTEAGEISSTCRRDNHAMENKIQISVSTNGRRLAFHSFEGTNVSATNRIIVWSLPDCQIVLEEKLEDDRRNAVNGLELNHDGSELLMLTPNGMHRWNVSSGEKQLIEQKLLIAAFALSPDGQRYAAYERVRGEPTRWVRIRNLMSGKKENEWQVSKRIKRIIWGPTGLLVETNQSTLYNAQGQIIRNLKMGGDLAVMSPDGHYIAAIGGNGHIEVRDAVSGAAVARSVRGANFRNLAFTPDSRSIVTVSSNQFDVGIWHFDPSGAYAALKPGGNAGRIWFSEDSLKLLAADGQGAAVWRLPAIGSYSAPVLLENTLGAGLRGQTLQLREAANADGDRQVLALATGVSGRRAVIVAGQITRGGFQRMLESWEGDVKLAEQPYEPVLDRDRETFLQFAGRDRFLVIGTRTGLEMVDAKTLAPVTTLYHTGAILAAAQADGRRAATMDRNGSIRVWDIANGREISRLAADNGAQMLALSNNGRWLATLTGSGKIELWAIAADDLIAQTCHWLEKPCP